MSTLVTHPSLGQGAALLSCTFSLPFANSVVFSVPDPSAISTRKFWWSYPPSKPLKSVEVTPWCKLLSAWKALGMVPPFSLSRTQRTQLPGLKKLLKQQKAHKHQYQGGMTWKGEHWQRIKGKILVGSWKIWHRFVKYNILEGFERGHSATARVPERVDMSSLSNFISSHCLRKFLPCLIKIEVILMSYCLLNQQWTVNLRNGLENFSNSS